MASSNTPNISTPSTICSVTLPVETTATGASNEIGTNVLTERNSSLAFPHRLMSDIPEIPDIPSPLLRPPTAGQAAVPSSETGTNFQFSSTSVASNDHGR